MLKFYVVDNQPYMLPELTAYGKGTIQWYKLHRPLAKKLGNTYNRYLHFYSKFVTNDLSFINNNQ
jgi:hypothetical protein